MTSDETIGAGFSTSIVSETSSAASCPITDYRQYNFTAFDYPQTTFDPVTWREILKIGVYLCLLVFALLGNLLVIFVVYYNQSMRSTINFYLVNLAVADFLIACCCMWVHLVNQLTYPLFVLGAFMCKFNSFAQMTTLTASVMTLAVISCDRFLAVIFPLRVRLVQQRPCLIIGLIWTVAMAVSVPFLVYKEHSEIKWKNFVETQCVERWPVKVTYNEQTGCTVTFPSKQIYYCLVTVSLFFLPIIVMTATYCMIVWRLWFTEMPGERSDAAVNTQSRAKRKKFTMQVVKLVFIVLIVFIICWMPLQVLILYNEFLHSQQTNGQLPVWFEDLSFFAYFIAYANSAINPVIYGGFNANYRQGIKAILRCRQRSHFPIRTRYKYGCAMTTTPSSSWRQRDKNSASSLSSHEPLQPIQTTIELKYLEMASGKKQIIKNNKKKIWT